MSEKIFLYIIIAIIWAIIGLINQAYKKQTEKQKKSNNKKVIKKYQSDKLDDEEEIFKNLNNTLNSEKTINKSQVEKVNKKENKVYETSYKDKEILELQKKYDYIILLQPTQPIRTVLLLKDIIERVIDQKLSSLVTVCPVEEHPILMRTMDADGNLKPLLHCSSTVRRQDFPAVYKVNGSVYMNLIDENFNENTSLNDNQYGYKMERKDSIDIDTMEDWKQAEQALRVRRIQDEK